MDRTSVKLVADSISKSGNRISTFELIYPRIIHSELLTHRMFSRNASSSRAVPILKQMMFIMSLLFIPDHFPKNNRGMSPKESLNPFMNFIASMLYYIGTCMNLIGSLLMKGLMVHKEIANRQTEYFSYIKVLVTATEFDNFLKLRTHITAQKEIRRVAELIEHELRNSTPETLCNGEWHTPYVEHFRDECGDILYGIINTDNEVTYISKEDAIKVSTSCAAQISYRNQDKNLKTCQQRYKRFLSSNPKHSSPFEHCATPITNESKVFNLQRGVTHIDSHGEQWSSNLKGWIQLRNVL